ncbi:MAG: homoserine O-acetyltransferase [Puniceicoccales bacterium]|jgi:homoserine O-acetyltransferase|nr:homoserine O-acetyltransferase [Puniceicoccales bacterium]
MTDDDSNTSAIEGGDAGLVHFQEFHTGTPFSFELGGSLPALTLRYETYGTLNAARSNAVLVCHALSGDHHVAGRYAPDDRKPGWWDAFVGPGRPLDTSRFFIIGVNCVGGCQGSSGPVSANLKTGRPYCLDFPQITMRDIVRAQRLLVRELGIERLHAVIGGSMGGMQSLLWAVDYPDEVRNVVALACSTRQSTQAIAFNEIGRNAILRDPDWQGGHYTPGCGPKNGLALARMLGHVTYLSAPGMERKFGRRLQARGDGGGDRSHGDLCRCDSGGRGPFGIEFAVEGYLEYQGRVFVERFDANSYLYITKASDRFDLTESGTLNLEDVFAPVTARVRLIGFSSDWLYPPLENKLAFEALRRAGKNAGCVEIETDAGHDAFLLPSKELFRAIHAGLE